MSGLGERGAWGEFPHVSIPQPRLLAGGMGGVPPCFNSTAKAAEEAASEATAAEEAAEATAAEEA